LSIAIFLNIDISQGSVATRLRCGGIFKYELVANLPVSLPVTEIWKSVNISGSYGQEFGVLFFSETQCTIKISRIMLEYANYAWICMEGVAVGASAKVFDKTYQELMTRTLVNFWQIRLWNLPRKKCVRAITAHDGYVRGLCFHQNGNYFFSVSSTYVFLHSSCSVFPWQMKMQHKITQMIIAQ